MAPTIYIFARDGALYFLVMFLANLMNTLIYFVSHCLPLDSPRPKSFIDIHLQLAPLDLRALGASFSQLITSVMISRLVLNLRSLSTEYHSGSSGPNMHRVIPDQSFLTRTIGEDIMFVSSGYTPAAAGHSEDKLEVGIPLVNVSRRSEVLGNTP
jgi:hypothetical protein